MVSCRSGVRQKHFPFSPLVLVNRQLPSPTQTCPNALTVSRRLCVFVSVRLSVCLFLCMSSSMNHHFGCTSISLYLCLYLAVSLSRYLVWLISSCLFFLFGPLVSLHLLCPLESPAIRSPPFAPSAAAAVSGASASSPSSAPAPNQVIRSSPPRPTRPSTECRQLHSYQADSWQSATDRKPICPNTARSHAGCASLHSCQADVGPNTLARGLTRVRASMPA